MIRVIRTAEPTVLINNKVKWTTDYRRARAAYNRKPTKNNLRRKNAAESKYNHRAVRTELITMCHGKCVYCESHVMHVSYPHIEHFRPKAKFPNLCFEWENFFLACSICNGSMYKSDKWPTSASGGPFIDPEIENPNTYFEFNFDPITGVSDVKPKGRRAKTTEKIFGLNRIDLLKHRNPVVKKLAYIALQASKGDVDALKEIKDSMQPDQEYAAFARAFFRKYRLT